MSKTVFPLKLNISNFVEARLIRYGITFAAGQCIQPNDFLLWEYNQPLRQHLQVNSYWSDGSVRWMLADTVAQQEHQLELRKQRISISSNSEHLHLNSDQQRLHLAYSSLASAPLQLQLVLHHHQKQLAQMNPPELCLQSMFSMAAAAYHYCHWIAEHEQPFLMQPEPLEFPNLTWSAQNIRKVMLLRQAVQFFQADAALCLAPAKRWYQWLRQKLLDLKELEFASVQVLLLFLHGTQQPAPDEKALPAAPACNETAPQLSLGSLFWRIIKTIGHGLLEFRPARERQWLKNRMSS